MSPTPSRLGVDEFRSIVGAFPTGVAILTTTDAAGAPRGLTTQAFISVSTDPMLILVSIGKSSRTLPSVMSSGAFVLNFLAAGREHLANAFASKSEDKFSGVSWRPSTTAAGAPILAGDVVAYAECVVSQQIEAGDHWLFLAVPVDGMALEAVPLMYYRRSYAPWPRGERPLRARLRIDAEEAWLPAW